MVGTTLYANNEVDINIAEHDDRFCLNLTKLFDFDLSIVGERSYLKNFWRS